MSLELDSLVLNSPDTAVGHRRQLKDKLIEHKHYIEKHGEDLPEIRHWHWGATSPTLRE